MPAYSSTQSGWLLQLLLLLLVPYLVCWTDSNNECNFEKRDKSNLYKSGDAIIGGILSLVRLNTFEINFQKLPEKKLNTFM